MTVLVACELYQTVTIALRHLGHEAYSCDLLDQEGGYAGKFANRNTKQCKFTLNSKLTIEAQDVDFSFEYKSQLDFAEFHFNKKSKLTEMEIAFNGDFLTEALQKTPKDSAAEIQLWGPTKAAVINKHFLLMPLMLNK